MTTARRRAEVKGEGRGEEETRARREEREVLYLADWRRPAGTAAPRQGDRREAELAARVAELEREKARLEERLGAAQAVPAAAAVPALEALDRLSLGVILVDQTARVLFANRAARETSRLADGMSIESGRLSAATVAESAALRSLVAAQAAAAGGPAAPAAGNPPGASAMALSRPSMRRPLGVLVVPLPKGAAAVFVTDPEEEQEVPPAVLQRLWDLTPAEAAMAVEISRGRGIGHAAQALGVQECTARTHLTRTFNKTGTRRQAELARLLLRLAHVRLA